MKRFGLWLCLMALLLSMASPTIAYAANMEPEHPCSLTLHYVKDGVGFADLEIRIFRVAEFAADGSYSLSGAFAGYPVKIHDITSQQEWKTAAQTLEAFTQADAIAPTAAARTNAAGDVVFEGLETGLYLVAGVGAATENSRFRFDPFMIFLPTPGDDGAYHYDMEAKPKAGEATYFTQYILIKLWKDAGREASRSPYVTIDIYKDGVRWNTVRLDESCNWYYEWETEDLEARWHVVEIDIPAGYTVTTTERGNTFTVINSTDDTPPPPQTGDTTPLWFYTLLMGVSGLGLVFLSVLQKRKAE